MISTSSYKNINTDLYKTYSISGDAGKSIGYTGECYSKLAPKLSFWKTWHENIENIDEEENNKYYIEEYYEQILSVLDPNEVYDELNYSILLCYEDENEFCHRHIVAEWLNLLLDVDIPEIKITENGIEEVERPQYIREHLEDVIKKDKNMRGFNSLRAAYLFEQSEKLEQNANRLEELGKKCDDYRQLACYLRCDADEAEALYKKKRLIKK